VRNIPCTAIEVSLAVSNAAFKLGELDFMYEAVELNASDSGEHAANLLDAATEVVIADVGHRFQDEGNFIGLGITDYGIAFFHECGSYTAHDLSELGIEWTQAIFGHVVECTTVKTDAYWKSRQESSLRLDGLVFFHEDIKVRI
jgi:hypothetical protein